MGKGDPPCPLHLSRDVVPPRSSGIADAIATKAAPGCKTTCRVASGRALITGIAGQDGSLLAELLIAEGCEVCGVVHRPTAERYENLDRVRSRIALIQVDVIDRRLLAATLAEFRPTEVYNLASPSFVPMSWQEPDLTAEFAAVGVTSMLEAIRAVDPEIRFYQASSSEIFGEPLHAPQTESTPISPVTPFGVAKAYGHFITRAYRRRYGLHASSGILYNHESSRRPLDFLPRKVAHGAATIRLGLADKLVLGTLDARRDWGYAGDYVHAMRLMLQQDEPNDYVIASGVSHSVRDLVEIAFDHLGLAWQDYVQTDEELVRGRAELHNLVGDPSKARTDLGWKPTIEFEGAHSNARRRGSPTHTRRGRSRDRGPSPRRPRPA